MLKYRETLEILKYFVEPLILFYSSGHHFFPKKIRIECHFKCIGLCKQAHFSLFLFYLFSFEIRIFILKL